ncbi:MAG: SMI1/KNR4 family protein [Verrucomicrobiae bacterium]|nr:SMI1/KNR4 family protein [Verrucomicrobiae bacterium]
MTESGIAEIESKLGVRVPPDYRQFMRSGSGPEMPGMFSDPHQIIAVNERNRQMSWLGRPLDRVFYIFAADKRGREIFMDLDIPEPVIMVADYERHCGIVQARTFQDWISKYDTA